MGQLPKRNVPNDDDPKTYDERIFDLRTAKGVGRGYVKALNVLCRIIYPDNVLVLSWLLERTQQLHSRPIRLGPEYKNWNYLTSVQFVRKFPALGIGKTKNAVACIITRLLSRQEILKWVEFKSGEDLARELDVDMPLRWRRFRWYRVKAGFLQAEMRRVCKELEEQIREEEKERERKKRRAEKIERSKAVEWALDLRDAFKHIGKEPLFDKFEWAKLLSKLVRKHGEEEVDLSVTLYTACARHQTMDGDVLPMAKFGLPQVHDILHFCNAYPYIANRMRDVRRKAWEEKGSFWASYKAMIGYSEYEW